jgi:hypothetical protein
MDGWGADISIQIRRRWVRLGIFYGTPPGSHIGVWFTRRPPLYGVNLRVGWRYIGPCLGMLAHTQRKPR